MSNESMRGEFGAPCIVFGRLDDDAIARWHVVLPPDRLIDGRRLSHVVGCCVVPMPCDDLSHASEYQSTLPTGVLLTAREAPHDQH